MKKSILLLVAAIPLAVLVVVISQIIDGHNDRKQYERIQKKTISYIGGQLLWMSQDIPFSGKSSSPFIPVIESMDSSDIQTWNDAYSDVQYVIPFPQQDTLRVIREISFDSGILMERRIYPVAVGILNAADASIVNEDYCREYWYWLIHEMKEKGTRVGRVDDYHTYELPRLVSFVSNKAYCYVPIDIGLFDTNNALRNQFVRLGFNEYYGNTVIRLFCIDEIVSAYRIKKRVE